MKFEANIPSYLRTGQGVFPVKDTAASKTKKETNFFKLMQKGVEMPVSNDKTTLEFAPIGDTTSKEPMDAENFLDKMQRNMEKGVPMGDAPVDMELGPKKFPRDPDARPVMPQIKPQVITEPQQMEAKAEDADIFIG